MTCSGEKQILFAYIDLMLFASEQRLQVTKQKETSEKAMFKLSIDHE